MDKTILIAHWKTLKWHRPLVLFDGDCSPLDILAGDPSSATAVVIQVQSSQDEEELFKTLSGYLDLLRPKARMPITGIIIANRPSQPLRRKAKEAGIEVFIPSVSVEKHLSSSREAKIKVSVQRCP